MIESERETERVLEASIYTWLVVLQEMMEVEVEVVEF